MNRTDEREKFEKFLFIMDDQLEALEENAASYGINLHRDLESLEKLEDLFDAMTIEFCKEQKNNLSITFGRYLGEIVRGNFGGLWHLPLDDPKNINFNTPVIIGHSKIEGLEFPALGVMHAYSVRKKTGLLRKSILSQIAPVAVEIDHLEEK